MGRHLTLAQKRKFFELILERDGGLHCLYCKRLQSLQTVRLEHLNGDNTDNRLDNLAFSCQSCNIKKSKDNEEGERLTTMADAKLVTNEQRLCVGEKFTKSLSNKMGIYGQASKEIEINNKNYDIVERYLRDTIDKFGLILFRDALDSCVYLCKSNTGHGSQQSMRNYLATLTSSVAPYEIIKNPENKKIIRKRLKN